MNILKCVIYVHIYMNTQEDMVKIGEKIENHSREMERPKKEQNGIIMGEK